MGQHTRRAGRAGLAEQNSWATRLLHWDQIATCGKLVKECMAMAVCQSQTINMIRPWLEGHFRSIQCFLGLWDRKAASSSSSCCWLGQLWQLCLNFHGSFRTQTSCTSLVRPSRSDGSRACGSIPDHLACRAGHKTTPSSNCKACHSGLEDFKESICKKRQPHRDRERERESDMARPHSAPTK